MVLDVIRALFGGWLLPVGWLLCCGGLRGEDGGGEISLFETIDHGWKD